MEISLLTRQATAIIGLLLAVTVSVSAQPLTTARDDYPSSPGARGITYADFNRDGWIDIATANEAPDGVAVLLNGGRSISGFTATFVALPGGPFDLDARDLNHDAVPDIAVANADGDQINVLFGRPSGGFTIAPPIAAPGGPRGLTIADMDGDGDLDIIYTQFDAAGVQVLHGNGAGTFAARTAAAPVSAKPQGVVAGDFNMDGRLDLAVATSGASRVTLLLQSAAGTFSRRDVHGEVNPNVLASGDFDEDGRLDVAAASTNQASVDIYRGVPGGLSYAATYLTGPQPRGMAAADLNRDGRIDLITGNRGSSTVSVLAGEPDGTFADSLEIAAGRGSRVVAVADFDNDGRLDVATGNEHASSITVLSNTTPFTRVGLAFHRQTIGTRSNTGRGVASAGIADFDHDGRLDAATQAAFRGFVTILANGRTTLTAPDELIGRIDAARLNGDAHPDVIVSMSSGIGVPSTMLTFLGDGTGAFPNSMGSEADILVSGYRLVDMTRDGRLDVLAFGAVPGDFENGQVQLLPGRGDGGFSKGARIPLRARSLGIAIGDVNRDGALDFVTYYEDCCGPGNAFADVHAGSGTGTFTLIQTVRFSEWSDFAGAGLADLDLDGHLDLVAASAIFRPEGNPFFEFRLGVARGAADGFGEPQYGPGLQPDMFFGGTGFADLHPEGLGDLNVDGRVDVFGNGGDLLRGRGDGTFEAAEGFSVTHVIDVQIVDFDGDGLPDIVYPERAGSVEVLINQRQATNTVPTVDAGPDRSHAYDVQFDVEPIGFPADALDADGHRVTFEWRDANGRLVSSDRFVELPVLPPGDYPFTITVTDGRGGVASDAVVVTIQPLKEMVLHVAQNFVFTRGDWDVVNDASAASGVRIHDRNAGVPKVKRPLADPPNGSADIGFVADPTQTYKLWVRLRADGDTWSSDSVWIQVTGAVDGAGRAIGAPGTTEGIEINLEECAGCGVSGWGWRDEAWGARGAIGTLTLRFPQGGQQHLRFQTREDGVSIDQFVLSAETYFTTRPGAVKDDTVILPPTLIWQRF